MLGGQHMPVALILPPRLPWTDNRDGLLSLRSPLIRGPGSSSPSSGSSGSSTLQDLGIGPPEAPPHMRGPQSETRMSGSTAMHFGLIVSQGRQGPTAATGFSEVSSDWGPGSPQSPLRVLKLKPWRSWASSFGSPEATPPFPDPQFV